MSNIVVKGAKYVIHYLHDGETTHDGPPALIEREITRINNRKVFIQGKEIVTVGDQITFQCPEKDHGEVIYQFTTSTNNKFFINGKAAITENDKPKLLGGHPSYEQEISIISNPQSKVTIK